MKLQLQFWPDLAYIWAEMEAHINLPYIIVALLSLQKIVNALQQFPEVGEIIN